MKVKWITVLPAAGRKPCCRRLLATPRRGEEHREEFDSKCCDANRIKLAQDKFHPRAFVFLNTSEIFNPELLTQPAKN
jgi:hypothetical protein